MGAGRWGDRLHLLRTVAVGALAGRVLVDHDLFLRDQLRLLVTLVAGHVGVTTGEREMGLGIMIKD